MVVDIYILLQDIYLHNEIYICRCIYLCIHLYLYLYWYLYMCLYIVMIYNTYICTYIKYICLYIYMNVCKVISNYIFLILKKFQNWNLVFFIIRLSFVLYLSSICRIQYVWVTNSETKNKIFIIFKNSFFFLLILLDKLNFFRLPLFSFSFKIHKSISIKVL